MAMLRARGLACTAHVSHALPLRAQLAMPCARCVAMNTQTKVSATGAWGLTGGAMAVVLLVGCSPMQTTTSVQATPQPEKQLLLPPICVALAV